MNDINLDITAVYAADDRGQDRATEKPHHRRQMQPLSPTSVLVTRPFDRRGRGLSDMSLSTAVSAHSANSSKDSKERSREYLPAVVFSPESLQNQSHRRLVSYDDMDELNQKLQQLVTQQDQSTQLASTAEEGADERDRQKRLEDFPSLHMPICRNGQEGEPETDAEGDSNNNVETRSLGVTILPRPKLLRSDRAVRRFFQKDDDDEDDDKSVIEDDLEVFAKRCFRQQQAQHQRKPSHSDVSGSLPSGRREPCSDNDDGFGFQLGNTDHPDDLLNKEIIVIRTSEAARPTHRRWASMAGL